MAEIFIPTLKQTVIITVFVLLMMIVIEYINVQSKNNWADKLQQSPFIQIIIAALLGITPGCLGAFTVVSLYTHRMMSIAGLVTVMIATSGDEAFVMFALFPGKAFILQAVLFLVAIVAGWIVYLFTRNKVSDSSYGFVVHEDENCHCFVKSLIIPQIKNMSFERAVFLILTLIFIVLLGTDIIGPKEWNWKKITILSGVVFLLFVIITVPEHFLKEHLYDHILKKHLLRIFLWTWGAFIALHYIQINDIGETLIQDNSYIILLISVVIGIIPESGPHLVFVTMYSQNLIPFSILMANSIVQDGHGMLPLLAESRRDFLKVKAINMIVALLVGFILFQIGY